MDGQESENGDQETGEEARLRVQGARRRPELDLCSGDREGEPVPAGLWGWEAGGSTCWAILRVSCLGVPQAGQARHLLGG